MEDFPSQTNQATACGKVDTIGFGAHTFCEDLEEGFQIDVPCVEPLFTDQRQDKGDGTVDGVAQGLMFSPIVCGNAHDAVAEGKGFFVLASS